MTPTGWIDFAFDFGLMVCLKDDRKDPEMHISFERWLSLQLAAKEVQSLFLASQIQKKKHFIEDLHTFLSVTDKSITEIQFFRTTNLEQYHLAPTSTA